MRSDFFQSGSGENTWFVPKLTFKTRAERPSGKRAVGSFGCLTKQNATKPSVIPAGTPHSHRFDFQCLVLEGTVHNRVWFKANSGDPFQETILEHHGTFGDQTRRGAVSTANWSFTQTIYNKGQMYSMKAEQVHSIFFSKGAVVLFFEGPNRSDSSSVLEPVSNGRVIPTFKVEPWMFKKD